MIGCQLVKNNNEGGIIRGIIVETEAYSQEEEACHGYYKMTSSNKFLFGEPGRFYVYKCYGMHYCLNIVTDKENFASGVLIRAVFVADSHERSASGPGLVTKKFGVDLSFNALKVLENDSLWINKGESIFEKENILQTTRIGINKAKNIKWRWYLKSSRSVSKREKGDKTPNLKNLNKHSSLKF